MKTTWLISFVTSAMLQQAAAQLVTTATATGTKATTDTLTATDPSTSTSPTSTTTSSSPTSTTSTIPTTTTTSPTTSIPSTTTTSTTPSTTSTSTTSTHKTSTTTSAPTTSNSMTATSTTSSASATSTLNQNLTNTSSSLSGGPIAGIVVGCVVGVALLACLAFFCLKKRRRHYEDEDYMKDQNYVEDPPYEMQAAVGDAPVSAFSPAAAYRQQQTQYTDPAYMDPSSEYAAADQSTWPQQGFTRQRSVRYPVESYGYQPGRNHYDNPNMQEGQYIGHPSDKYEDPSSYHNPNTPTGPTHSGAAAAGAVGGATAAGIAAMAYSRGDNSRGRYSQEEYSQGDYGSRGNSSERYEQPEQGSGPSQYGYAGQNPGQHDQNRDTYQQPAEHGAGYGATGPPTGVGAAGAVHETDNQGPAASKVHDPVSGSSDQEEAQDLSSHPAQREQAFSQQLPPPHGLDKNWDLYNYAYAPPSNNKGKGTDPLNH